MGKKYYAVREGRVRGIYDSWAACERQVKAMVVPFTNLLCQNRKRKLLWRKILRLLKACPWKNI